MDDESVLDRLADRLGASRAEAAGLALLILGGLVIVLVLLWWQRPASPVDGIGRTSQLTQGDGVALQGASLVVHVTGAVMAPGVVRTTDGARVLDVLALVGGASGDADLRALNLARLVVDGEQIIVPTRRSGAGGGDTAGGEESRGRVHDDQGRLNINLATTQQLQELPGVGPVLAQRIVSHRDAHGPFGQAGDLRAVAGIGEKTFQSLAPLIHV